MDYFLRLLTYAHLQLHDIHCRSLMEMKHDYYQVYHALAQEHVYKSTQRVNFTQKLT